MTNAAVLTRTILVVYRAQWATDPFALKLYSLLQNIFGPNFSDGLNFVTREHCLKKISVIYTNKNTKEAKREEEKSQRINKALMSIFRRRIRC